MPTSQVTVAKESLGFSAAHFLTLPGHKCERMHGHNYRVAVTVEGSVDARSGFVIDFADLKRVVREVIEPLDHRLLVPTANISLRLREDGERLVVDYTRPEWLTLPRDQACLVPVPQTTAELLADWMAEQVWNALVTTGGRRLARLSLELEESAGQSARAERSS